MDVDDLLQEQEFISDDERTSILADIDEEFISFLRDPESIGPFTARSSGFLVSILAGFGSLVVATVVILLAMIVFDSRTAVSETVAEIEETSSQWQILNLYIEEAEKLISEKDTEIESYRAEIRNYDAKIETLRDLLKLKDETQNRLFGIRQRLSVDGLDETQINERLADLENEVTSGLSAENLQIYSLSIEEINTRIDEILNEKENTEERLKLRLTERQALATESEEIEEDIRVRESQSFATREMLNTIEDLNMTISGYRQLDSDRSGLAADYGKILESIENGDYDSARRSIEGLETRILGYRNSRQADMVYDFALEQQSVQLLQDYLRRVSEADRRPVPPSGEAVESREPPAAAPIVPEKTVRTDTGTEPNTPQYVPIGRVKITEFNRIEILADDVSAITEGTRFRIFRSEDSDAAAEIGSGVITGRQSDLVIGRLESLVSLSNTPEPGDRVFIENR